ncbi:MAG: hypothetical protein Q9191_001355 [Dirinaria sp. TL-2023a]
MGSLSIVLIGTCDTKLSELLYLHSRILASAKDTNVILIDAGRKPIYHPTISIRQDELLTKYRQPPQSSGKAASDISNLSRAEVIQTMTECATACMSELYSKRPVHGAISIGGSCGTSLASAIMRGALPFTFPKLIVSTVASGDTSHIVGESDITLMYSIVDIAGSNRILNCVLDNAAGAIVGLARAHQVRLQSEQGQDQNSSQRAVRGNKTRIGITMFGVTTPCVEAMRHHLTETYDYEVYIFHATGHGGRAMERLINSGELDALIDLTTTEIPDQIVGGVMAAGPDRLKAAAKAGIPQIVSVGACDMVNFGPRNTLPERFGKGGRNIFEHNASVTLMRTNSGECKQIGQFIVSKLKEFCVRPDLVQVVLPVGGISMISKPQDPFEDKDADEALFETIEDGLKGSKTEVVRDERDINNPSFAVDVAERLVKLIQLQRQQKRAEP